jgi:hypothetical protein
MKVEIDWRPSMAGQPMNGGGPATLSLFSSFPIHYLPFYLNHPTFGTKYRGNGHMGWLAGHLLAPL